MFFLLLGAIMISFAPILVKAIHLPPSWSAVGRLSMAACILGVILLGRFLLKKESFKETFPILRPSLALLIGAGLFFGIDLYFWHRSIHYTGAGVATILGSTQVLFLTLYTSMETKKIPSRRFLIASVLAMTGLFLLVNLKQNMTRENYAWGVFFGMMTGICYGGFLLLLRKAGLRSPEISILWRLFLFSAAGAVFLLVLTLATQPVPVLTVRDLGFLVLLGGVVHIGGWSLISKNLPRTSAAKGGLILITQPVLATALGWLFFKEQLAPLQILGMAVTLSAIYLGETARS